MTMRDTRNRCLLFLLDSQLRNYKVGEGRHERSRTPGPGIARLQKAYHGLFPTASTLLPQRAWRPRTA